MQAGAGCSYHPAPCLRRIRLHTQRLRPRLAITIIPFCPGNYKEGRREIDFVLYLSMALVYGLFSVPGAVFVSRERKSGGGRGKTFFFVVRPFSPIPTPASPSSNPRERQKLDKEDTIEV